MTDTERSRDELIAELCALRAELARLTGGPDAAQIEAEIEDTALERARAVVAELDESFTLTFISPSIEELLGYTPEELVGRRDFNELLGAEPVEETGRRREEMHTSGENSRSVYQARHRDGHWIWVETVAVPHTGPDGRSRTVAVCHDVTAWKEARDTLRRTEARFQALARNASDLIVEVDGEGRFLYVSPNCTRLLGRAPEEAIGKTIAEIGGAQDVHPADLSRLLEGFERNVRSGGEGGEVTSRFRHADGSWRWFDSIGRTYRLADGSLRAVVISRDVTERVKTEAALLESRDRYRVLARGSRDVIGEMDREGRVTYMSETSVELTGYRPEELLGTTTFHLVHPDDVDRILALFLEGVNSGRQVVVVEPYRVRHRDGSWRWCEGSGLTYERADGEIRFLSVTRDITERVLAQEERRRLEQQVQQAQKLEGLGVMAGGIAHDFNNLLTPILGDASLAVMELPADSPARARLQKIQRAAHRAAALTNQMLAYAGSGPLLVEPLDLSKLVHEMGQLLESAISQKAVLVYRLPPDLPRVEADGAQLSQVVMNLLTNASEAVGDLGGRIAIRTGRVEIDDDSPTRSVLGERLPGGTYAFVEVTDDGCGMDDDTRARIFDPFFTTKFTGRGLGLAAVLGIVRGHKGAVEIESAPGQGTRFRVLFPASEILAAREADDLRTEASWAGGSGLVLVVDDDEGVRDLACSALERAGFEALGAADGREGLEIFRRRTDEIRAVLLDRTMPSGGGEAVFHEMRAIRPDARIVLVSGYSEDRAAENLTGRGLAGFLQKPFLPADLVRKIREVLEE